MTEITSPAIKPIRTSAAMPPVTRRARVITPSKLGQMPAHYPRITARSPDAPAIQRLVSRLKNAVEEDDHARGDVVPHRATRRRCDCRGPSPAHAADQAGRVARLPRGAVRAPRRPGRHLPAAATRAA